MTPSICFDTFGLVSLEAMEMKKPVVATSFGGSKEVIEDGVTGFIENPFDVAAYADKIGKYPDRFGPVRLREEEEPLGAQAM